MLVNGQPVEFKHKRQRKTFRAVTIRVEVSDIDRREAQAARLAQCPEAYCGDESCRLRHTEAEYLEGVR